MKIKELKSKLKQDAVTLRKAKQLFKESQRQGSFDIYKNWAIAEKLSDSYQTSKGLVHYARLPAELARDYRHYHIAYCMLRGKKYEQIENKVREGNQPSMPRVESIMEEYREVEVVNV